MTLRTIILFSAFIFSALISGQSFSQEQMCQPVILKTGRICGLNITETERACNQLKRDAANLRCPDRPHNGPSCCHLLTESIDCTGTQDDDLLWCIEAHKKCNYGCN